MSAPLVPASFDLSREIASAERFAAAARSPRTIAAYQGDLRRFDAWCRMRQLAPIPAQAETIAFYASELADQKKKVSTITRALSAIYEAHRLAGLVPPKDSPIVREVMKGIRRTLTVSRTRKNPILEVHLRAMVAATSRELMGVRDRALLVVGWNGALRRRELIGIDATDLHRIPEGIVLTLAQRKNDQEGEGSKILLPVQSDAALCPVRTLDLWLQDTGILQGPVFRPFDAQGALLTTRLTDRMVALIVKRTLRRAGFDPKLFSGHSLRSGLVTAAYLAGKSNALIMRKTGHRDLRSLAAYIRDLDLRRDDAAGGLISDPKSM